MDKQHIVYMGADKREQLAYDVACSSILSRITDSTWIIPIGIHESAGDPIRNRPYEYRDGKLWCPISEAPMATEFAIARFGVPRLKSKGWALFCDCDIVCLTDIGELFKLADDKYAVMVVKHAPITNEPTVKMDGQIQTFYNRKNWSSVILWNCSHPSNKKLTEEILNTWPGRDLHAFKWLKDEEIGELPLEWNYLVDVSPPIQKSPNLLHFTLGGPWFPNWKGGSLDEAWLLEEAKLKVYK